MNIKLKQEAVSRFPEPRRPLTPPNMYSLVWRFRQSLIHRRATRWTVAQSPVPDSGLLRNLQSKELWHA